ncbi:MAG: Xaa-Pro peptidase family protein [Acidimicrobiia bacterium]|nr:Xaa-Pro peptidase family protein [Acidimicrobiia bacterium]
MIQPTEYRSRIDTFRRALVESEVEAAVLSSRSNVIYFAGLRFDPLWSSATRSLIAVIPADGPVQLVLPGFIAEEAADLWPEAEVHSYQGPPDSVVPAVSSALRRAGSGRRVAFEMGPDSRIGFTLDEWTALRESLPGCELVDAQALIWPVRVVKSPAEIEALRVAAHAASAAFQEVFARPITGRSEREVARDIYAASLRNGADSVGWMAATSGQGSYNRFVSGPRDRIIERDDLFWADVGVLTSGYWTDVCRAVVAGPISERRHELQTAVVAATQAGIDAIRPGVPIATVAEAVRTRATELKLPMIGYGRLGHGIGLSATEPPSVAEWDLTILKEGMVITVEPAVEDETGIYCAEQVVAVTSRGADVLSIAPTHLVEGR